MKNLLKTCELRDNMLILIKRFFKIKTTKKSDRPQLILLLRFRIQTGMYHTIIIPLSFF